jgi:hypothetical protein
MFQIGDWRVLNAEFRMPEVCYPLLLALDKKSV